MDQNKIEQEIENLIKLINYHNWRYYVLQDPEISDQEYDSLLNKLKELEKKSGIIKPYSPTQRITYSLSKEFKKEKHLSPVLSIDSVYNINELQNYFKSVFKNLSIKSQNLDILCELKFDGISLSITYQKTENKFIIEKALTRGDGEYGEDLTNNAKTIKNIPLVIYIPEKLSKELKNVQKIQIKGEVVLYKKDLEIINQQRKKEGLPPFTNTRNAASGSIRQLDPSVTAKRNLKFFAYELKLFDNQEIIIKEKLSELFEILQTFQFTVSPNYKKTSIQNYQNLSNLQEYYNQIQKQKDNLEFDIDGVIFKIDNLHYQKILGNTMKNYKWAIAYKFHTNIYITKLIDVTFEVGRTGIITPVAILEPIEIEGVTVKNSSLHNFEYIKSKDIKIGDFVEIIRAGKVIPEIVKPIKELRTNQEIEIKEPEKCPSCNYNLTKQGPLLICTNHKCPEKIIAKIIHWFSKEAMNVDISYGIISKLIKNNMVKDIPDMYELTVSDLAVVGNLGKKSASKLYNSIQQSRNQTFDRIIYGLGIPGQGIKNSKILASKFNNIDQLRKASYSDLISIDGIGKENANNIIEFFKKEENIELINRLKKIMKNI